MSKLAFKLETTNTVTNIPRRGLGAFYNFRNFVFSYPSLLEEPFKPVPESLIMNVPSLLFKTSPTTSPLRPEIPETLERRHDFCAVAIGVSFQSEYAPPVMANSDNATANEPGKQLPVWF